MYTFRYILCSSEIMQTKDFIKTLLLDSQIDIHNLPYEGEYDKDTLYDDILTYKNELETIREMNDRLTTYYEEDRELSDRECRITLGNLMNAEYMVSELEERYPEFRLVMNEMTHQEATTQDEQNQEESSVTYQDIGKALTITLTHRGKRVSIQEDVYKALAGQQPQTVEVDVDTGIDLFNQLAEKHHLSPLYDPKGYMVPENNLIKEIYHTYQTTYEGALQAIEDGTIMGTTYSVQGVLNKLNSTVRKEMKDLVPDGLTYGDLRYIEMKPQYETFIRPMLSHRLDVTIIHSISRSFDKDEKDKAIHTFKQSVHQFKEFLSNDLTSEQHASLDLSR